MDACKRALSAGQCELVIRDAADRRLETVSALPSVIDDRMTLRTTRDLTRAPGGVAPYAATRGVRFFSLAHECM